MKNSEKDEVKKVANKEKETVKTELHNNGKVNKKEEKSAKIEEQENNIKEEHSIANNEKVQKIIEKAKENGKITYGELATELDDTDPEEIDKVFDAFEDLGVDLNDDIEEPDIEDLENVEEIKLEDMDVETVVRELGVSQNTVNNAVYRIMKKLKETVQKEKEANRI